MKEGSFLFCSYEIHWTGMFQTEYLESFWQEEK
jgi:hypothetical protein